jgi:23S rRNA (cytidine1920-2'-O)/16S rRNA (cytidine1409-2'-O)-methyltransferase
VRDPRAHADAIAGVGSAAAELGLGVAGAVASPLPGPSGNVEYFVWLRLGAPALDPAMVWDVVAAGPARAVGEEAP